MAILDIILLICFIPAIVMGISKGFVKQLIEILAIIIGAWAAFRFSSMASVWMSQYLTFDKKVLHIICFVIIFIIIALVLNLLGNLLTKAIKIIALGWLNRLLGLFFGVVKVAFILGLVIMIFEGINTNFHLVKEGILNDAVVYQAMKHFAENVFPYLKSFVTGINV